MTRSIADDIRDQLPRLAVEAETKKAIEEWLAADTEFNSWFLLTTKRAFADDELLDLLDGYRESQDMITRGWSEFQEESDISKLEACIAVSAAKIQSLMDDR